MSTTFTAQQMHEAFVQARGNISESGRDMFAHIPENWANLSEQQQEQFAAMARKLTAVVSEFEVEEA